MLSKRFFKNPKNTSLVVLILQIHMLLVALIGVLWIISFLNKGEAPKIFSIFFQQNEQQEQMVRPATVIIPDNK